MDTEQEEPIQEQGAEAAFEEAKLGFELFGKPLRDYSPSRKKAAQAMGLMYPWIGDERMEKMLQTGIYGGMLKDVSLVLWLCILPDKPLTKKEIEENKGDEKTWPWDGWTPTMAANKPQAAMIRAETWATKNGLDEVASAEFLEAAQVALAIVRCVEASKFKLYVPGAEQAEDDSPKV